MNLRKQKSKCILTCLAVLIALSAFSQLTITEVKSKPLGSIVTFQGIAISGSELGAVRYFQDDGAGIAVYPTSSSQAGFDQVKEGDFVLVTGILKSYRGLIEVSPVLSFEIVGENQPLPEPLVGSFDEISNEEHIGKRVRLECVQFEYDHKVFHWGKHRVFDKHGTESELDVGSDNPLVGKNIPYGAFDLIGISSFEYKPKILVSGSDDFITSNCLAVTPIAVTKIEKDKLTFEWQSNQAGSAIMRYGSDPENLTYAEIGGDGTLHSDIVFGPLDPATIWYVQGGVNVEGNEAWSPLDQFITASESSGDIEVYFNNDVKDPNDALPDGETFAELMDAIFELIESAETSIDITMYNNNRVDIINALELAYASGVRVRYIADADRSNNALDPLPDFPVLFRSGSGIMHNKFIVIDPESVDNAQVWTGATNFTNYQLSVDPNNAILIHDQSLAKVYHIEFEEMWGGSADLPNPQMARQGEAKYDNTPHHFKVADTEMEVYFSPSDYTNYHILKELDAADESIDVGLLLITREDLADKLVERKQDGVDVRGIYNNHDDSEYALQILAAGGVDMRDYNRSTIFHHKYALIDNKSSSNPTLITGCHNWTYSADQINDENTLIIHSPFLTEVYSNEFAARWSEVSTGVDDVFENGSVSVSPNPFLDHISITSNEVIVSAKLYSADGREVLENQNPGQTINWNINSLENGIYFLRLRLENDMLGMLRLVKVGN